MDRRETPWLLVFILLTGTFIAALAANALGRFITGPDEFKLLATSGILEALAFLFIVAMAGLYRPGGVRLLGLRLIQIPRGIAAGIATIFVLFPLVLLVGQLTELAMHVVGLPPPQPHEVLEALRENHSARFVVTAIILVVVVAPMFEELAFRGCLQTLIARFFFWLETHGEPQVSAISPSGPSRWLAVIITAAIFAAVHHELGFFPPLMLLAIGLGYVYERTGNLWTTIFAHALFNAVQLLLFVGLS
jgi:membrane protease YdiL (CAAX protease family)